MCSISDENEIGIGVVGVQFEIDARIAWFSNELGKGVFEVIWFEKHEGVIDDETDNVMDMDDDDDDYDYDYDDDGDDGDDGDDDDDEDRLLPRKFRNSVFVRGLREAIEYGFKTAI